MRLLLLLLPLLAACRYTFLPLDPGKPPPPERPFVVARLLPEGQEARLLLKVDLGSPSLPDPEEVEDQGDGEEGQEGGDHHAPGHP